MFFIIWFWWAALSVSYTVILKYFQSQGKYNINLRYIRKSSGYTFKAYSMHIWDGEGWSKVNGINALGIYTTGFSYLICDW
jgi:hypothetical protein